MALPSSIPHPQAVVHEDVNTSHLYKMNKENDFLQVYSNPSHYYCQPEAHYREYSEDMLQSCAGYYKSTPEQSWDLSVSRKRGRSPDVPRSPPSEGGLDQSTDWSSSQQTSPPPSPESSQEDNNTPTRKKLRFTKSGNTSSRKARINFTTEQLDALEEHYHQNSYITQDERPTLAKAIGVREYQVKTWFQNRRSKDKKSGLVLPPVPGGVHTRNRPLSAGHNSSEEGEPKVEVQHLQVPAGEVLESQSSDAQVVPGNEPHLTESSSPSSTQVPDDNTLMREHVMHMSSAGHVIDDGSHVIPSADHVIPPADHVTAMSDYAVAPPHQVVVPQMLYCPLFMQGPMPPSDRFMMPHGMAGMQNPMEPMMCPYPYQPYPPQMMAMPSNMEGTQQMEMPQFQAVSGQNGEVKHNIVAQGSVYGSESHVTGLPLPLDHMRLPVILPDGQMFPDQMIPPPTNHNTDSSHVMQPANQIAVERHMLLPASQTEGEGQVTLNTSLDAPEQQTKYSPSVVSSVPNANPPSDVKDEEQQGVYPQRGPNNGQVVSMSSSVSPVKVYTVL